MRSVTSEKLIQVLSKEFATHGLPLSIRTDNTHYFVGNEFQEFLRQNSI